MATQAAGYTLLEMAKRIAPDGKQMDIAEIMSKEVSMLRDIPFYPSNDIWTNKSLRRANLPTPTWKALNQRVAASTSQADEVLDVIGICEAFASYDKLYIDRMPNPDRARVTEAKAFIEGMAQELTSAFLYSNNAVTPKKPHGIAPRLNALGRYVIASAGGAALTSIYVVSWGEDTVYGVYPKNGEGGSVDGYPIVHTDLGHRTSETSGGLIRVYEDNFRAEVGLVIRDNRHIGRVANIPSATASAQVIEDKLIELLNNMKTGAGTVMYMNETIATAMQIRQKDKTNAFWTPGKDGYALSGEPVMFFQGIPVRKIDSSILLNSESAVA